MTQIFKHPLALGLAALIWSAAPVFAQQAAPAADPPATASPAASTPKPAGSFKAWDAYTFEDKGRLMCYTQGEPAGSFGVSPGRGKAAVMVIQAPDAAAKDQVSIVLGFAPSDDKPVAVKIGRKRFSLKKFAVGRAWANSDSQDRQMVDAMKRADWMVVNAVSAKGEKVQDTYNLSGFGDAYDAAVKACK
jgi:hypothetical protein